MGMDMKQSAFTVHNIVRWKINVFVVQIYIWIRCFVLDTVQYYDVNIMVIYYFFQETKDQEVCTLRRHVEQVQTNSQNAKTSFHVSMLALESTMLCEKKLGL